MVVSAVPGAIGRASNQWANWRLAALCRLARKPSEGIGKVGWDPASSLGEPISATARDRLEPLLGRSFGGVRVHVGHEAEELAGALRAAAFTIGGHVFGGRDAMRKDGRESLPLLAHELAHVVQQTDPPLIDAPPLRGMELTGSDRRPTALGGLQIEPRSNQIQRALATAGAGSRVEDREAAAQAVEESVIALESTPRQEDVSSAVAVDPELIADKVYRLMREELLIEMERRASLVR